MRIVLTILLILLALVILILLLRVGGKVEFSELGLRAWIRLGPVYYQLYPKRPLPKLIQWLKNRKNRKKKAKSPPKAPERASGTPKGSGAGRQETKQPKPDGEGPQIAPDESKLDAKVSKPDAETAQAVPEVPKSDGGEAQTGPEESKKDGKEAQSGPGEPETDTEKPQTGPNEPQSDGEAAQTISKGPEPEPDSEPEEEHEPEPEPEPEEEPEPEPAPAPSRPGGGRLDQLLELLPDLLDLAGRGVRSLRVDQLSVQYTVPGRWDAAGAAVQYGTVYATGGVLYPILNKVLKVKSWQVGAEIDFQETVPRVYLCLNLSVRIGQIAALGLRGLWKYYNYRNKKKNPEKAGKQKG